MACTFRILATEMTDTKDKLYILAQELRGLKFPIAVVMDALAWFATMRAWGSMPFGISIYNESIRTFFHLSQLNTRRGTFVDYG